MKKQIFFLILLTLMAVSVKGQWTHHRTLSYEFVATGPGMWPQICTFDGVGYASMDWGLYGTTCAPSSGGPVQRFMNVLKIDEENDSIIHVDYMNDYGVSGRFMISEKKLGKVFRFGNWQGYPIFSVLDTLGNYTYFGIHPQGFSRCFSAFDINHLYSIFTNEFGAHIFYTRINEVGVKMDTFTTFAPQKIDFPAPDCGYMSIIEEGSGTQKILKSSPDLLSWDTLFQTTQTISDIVFDEVNAGYAILQPGMIIKTTDGGISWDTLYNNNAHVLKKLDVVDSSIVFACGNGGVVLRSINGGTTWTQDTFPSTVNLDQIIMFDENNGYAMSKNIVYRLKSPDPIIILPPDSVPKIKLGPNPTRGEFKISADVPIQAVEILDLGGKTLYTKETDNKEVEIDYFPNAAGLYFVRATFSNGQKRTEKIVFTR